MNDFKIPQKYLIDFDTLKVGDRVWSISEGYVSIHSISRMEKYPIKTSFDYDKRQRTYTYDGKYCDDDQYPSLFRSNPFDDLREEFFADRHVKVSQDGICWYYRKVFGLVKDKWLAWESEEVIEQCQLAVGISQWNYCNEITPPSEELVHLTLKDISEGKGKGVPAHLIRIKE